MHSATNAYTPTCGYWLADTASASSYSKTIRLWCDTTTGQWEVIDEEEDRPPPPPRTLVLDLVVPGGRDVNLMSGYTYRLPDGSELHVDAQGNFRLEDAAAEVIYKANRIREFNPFLNASDLLARFIEYVGSVGVRQGEVFSLPIGLFINWLIIEAALKDGDAPPHDVKPVPKLLAARPRPQCLLPSCRRFVRRAIVSAGFGYCGSQCAAQHGQLVLAGG